MVRDLQRRVADGDSPAARNGENPEPAFRQLGRILRNRTEELGELTGQLQDTLREIRMVAVSSMEPHWSRLVLTLGRELGKLVDFSFEGGDTQVDRAVLDFLREPLTHLLRNAVDHGLEAPEQRRTSGKPEAGRVSLRIGRQGHRMVAVLTDDGRGIDPDDVRRAAVRSGLLSEDECARLDGQQALDLVFRPGLSTRQTASEMSGRGFGLDVARTNLLRINGTIRVESQPGQGTTFTLEAPLTLATEHAVVVRAGGQAFALPVAAVERTLVAGEGDLVHLGGGRAVLIDGRPLPLRTLAEALGLAAGEFHQPAGLPVVVLSDGWQPIALSVEQVVAVQQVVVKPLQPPLDGLPGIGGGTVTARGDVILVLDPRELAARALGAVPSHAAADGGAEAPPLAILVVDDSLTSRVLQKNILEYAGYQVDTVADGAAGWEAVRRRPYDLVITDIDMPCMDGFELTEKIKQDERLKEVPVIMVTSKAKDGDRQRGIAVGADAYVVKGQFETKLLLDLVQQLVGA
jgi:two-component system chemotaxis sensor kinase CheA